MSDSYYQKQNRFYVENAYIDFEDIESDDPEIKSIVLELVNKSDRLYMYPKREVVQEKTVNGLEGKESKDVNYKVSNFQNERSELADLIKNAGTLDGDKVIVVEGTCHITEYDDGNKAYRMYDDMIQSDSFVLSTGSVKDMEGNPEDSNLEEQKEKTESLFGDDEGESK